MTTTTFEDARVGDRVWDFNEGWGVIEEINPISVRYNIYSARQKYTNSGQKLGGRVNQRTLFWDEIKFDSPPQPKRKVKKYLRLFKDGSGRWDVVCDCDEKDFKLYPIFYDAQECTSGGAYVYAEVEIEE